MDTQNKLLDKVRKECVIDSDAELADRLHVSRQLVSHWRKGRNPIPNETIAHLCAMAQIDGGAWAAAIHAERAASREEKAMWKSVLDRLSPVAVAVGLVAIGLGLSVAPRPAEATTEAVQGVHYAKFDP